MEDPELESRNFKKVTFISYSKTDDIRGKQLEKVMLGGRYWRLLYITANHYLGKKLYIYDEYTEKGDRNNIFVREKLKDN